MLRKSNFLQFTIAASIFLLGLGSFSKQSLTLSRSQQDVRQGYFVISIIVEGDRRDIYILLNEEYFKEETLRGLLREIFDKYPEPIKMDVWLYSAIEQVRGFVDGRPEHIWYLMREWKEPGFWNKHARGVMMRMDSNEIIRYRVPSDNDVNLKTIVVTGKDPYNNNK